MQWNVTATRPLAKHFFEWLAREVPGTVPGALDYEVGEDRYWVSGDSFFQVNRFLAEPSRTAAISDASGRGAWDLYAGVGLFSIPLARRFERVTAVESGTLGRGGPEAQCGTRYAPGEDGPAADRVVSRGGPKSARLRARRPPASGTRKGGHDKDSGAGPEKFTLIACDPATLARYLAALSTGYTIEKLTVADLFPQTFHIETIAHLSHR